MLQHYFGPGLLVYVGDVLESNPAVQAGSTGLSPTRSHCHEQDRRRHGVTSPQPKG